MAAILLVWDVTRATFWGRAIYTAIASCPLRVAIFVTMWTFFHIACLFAMFKDTVYTFSGTRAHTTVFRPRVGAQVFAIRLDNGNNSNREKRDFAEHICSVDGGKKKNEKIKIKIKSVNKTTRQRREKHSNVWVFTAQCTRKWV